MNNTTEKELVKKLREKYTKNPPEGMTAGMIKRMRDLSCIKTIPG